MAPGSLHPETGKPYTVIDDKPIAPAPGWLLALSLVEEKPEPKTPSPVQDVDGDLFQWTDGKIESLPISKEKRSLILNGSPKGARSEDVLGICNALVWSNLTDEQIFNIFDQYPIGEKYREKGATKQKWLQTRIDKARARVTDRAKAKQEKKKKDNAGSPFIDPDTDKPKKHKQASLVLLPELVEDGYAYDSISKTFYQYRNGMFHAITDHAFTEAVELLISEMDPNFDYAADFLKGVCSFLSIYLSWDSEDSEPDHHLIPFKNGVLDTRSMNLLPHSQVYRFTWQLPYAYNCSDTCEPVQKWLWEAVQDQLQIQLLRAYLNAILTGRSDLQRYLELIGPGGSGKGTFIRLAEAIVGKKNVHVTELKHLETNRFETARIYNKRLVVITDAEKYSGDVSTLKAMTGGDSLRFEEKHKQKGESFRFLGMVIIAANQDIKTADTTSGLYRRRITIGFDNAVPPEKRRDLESEFEPYIPGVINWVLGMPRDEVTALIANTDKFVKTLNGRNKQTLVNINPLAEFLHERTFYDSTLEIRPELAEVAGGMIRVESLMRIPCSTLLTAYFVKKLTVSR